MEDRTRRQIILDKIEDMVLCFQYYDRKEDETLQMNDVELAIEAGEITISEIVQHFSINFTEGLTFPAKPRGVK